MRVALIDDLTAGLETVRAEFLAALEGVTQEEFERRSQVPGTLPYWAKKEGKLVYDAAA